MGDRYRAHLEVNGKVTDAAGATVYQYDRSVPIDFSREQLESVRTKLFSFQDILPLVEGDYKLDVLLKNTMSKQFTSFEKKIAVPRITAPRLSPLILANRAVKESAYQGRNKPFLVADTQIVPSPRNDFTTGDTLIVYLQALGLSRDLAERGRLEFTVFREGEKASSVTVPLVEYPDKAAILREFPLAGLPSAYYRIQAALLDEDGNEIHTEQANFYISHLPALPRPWVLSLPFPAASRPMIANILGNQFFNLKNIARARTLLAEALRLDPASGRYALDYCRLLLAEKDHPQVKVVAGPFLETDLRVDFLHFLGQAHQALGELTEAIAVYKEYLAHYGTNLSVLNAIGDCYARLGNREEARVAWEKSLEISPGQPDIRKKLDALKEKK